MSRWPEPTRSPPPGASTGDAAAVDGAQERELLDRYVDAFERYDVTALVALLHEGSRLIRTAANGRPAFGAYRPAGPGVHEPFAIAVLELSGGRITGIADFLYPERFPAFGLPTRLVR